MKEKRKINKLKISIFIIIVILLTTALIFGRYISNYVRDLYLTSKQFYFTSDLLDMDTPTYEYKNWGGVDTYKIDIELYSYKNELLKLDYDIEYTLNCEINEPEKAEFSINSGTKNTEYNGIIYSKNNTDNISIYITPVTIMQNGEKIEILIKAKSKAPYQKEISAKFIISVTEQLANYKIQDNPNQNYALLSITNTSVVDSKVSIEFDPNIVRLDLNDEIYENCINSESTIIEDKEYINKITFIMKKEISKNIKFYKVDKTKNYSYPNGNNNCIVKITGI